MKSRSKKGEDRKYGLIGNDCVLRSKKIRKRKGKMVENEIERKIRIQIDGGL